MNLFCKIVYTSGCVEPEFSVTITQLCHCRAKAASTMPNEWGWLSPSNASLESTGSELTPALGGVDEF